jgi:hypothetical protein
LSIMPILKPQGVTEGSGGEGRISTKAASAASTNGTQILRFAQDDNNHNAVGTTNGRPLLCFAFGGRAMPVPTDLKLETSASFIHCLNNRVNKAIHIKIINIECYWGSFEKNIIHGINFLINNHKTALRPAFYKIFPIFIFMKK